jgi:hypothetical protein
MELLGIVWLKMVLLQNVRNLLEIFQTELNSHVNHIVQIVVAQNGNIIS